MMEEAFRDEFEVLPETNEELEHSQNLEALLLDDRRGGIKIDQKEGMAARANQLMDSLDLNTGFESYVANRREKAQKVPLISRE
jgi:hypothetical protein